MFEHSTKMGQAPSEIDLLLEGEQRWKFESRRRWKNGNVSKPADFWLFPLFGETWYMWLNLLDCVIKREVAKQCPQPHCYRFLMAWTLLLSGKRQKDFWFALAQNARTHPAQSVQESLLKFIALPDVSLLMYRVQDSLSGSAYQYESSSVAWPIVLAESLPSVSQS